MHTNRRFIVLQTWIYQALCIIYDMLTSQELMGMGYISGSNSSTVTKKTAIFDEN